MISVKNRFLFIHIPKTAGNAIQNCLKHYSEDRLVCPDPHQDGIERFEVSSDVYRISKHSTLEDYRRQLGDEVFSGLFRFSCVRNPWERAISFYFSPSRGSVGWDREKFIAFAKTIPPVEEYLSLAEDLPAGNHGFPGVDFIMRYENLDADFRKVCTLADIPWQPLDVRNRSNHAHYTSYYDDELIELVHGLFTNEIGYFEYRYGQGSNQPAASVASAGPRGQHSDGENAAGPNREVPSDPGNRPRRDGLGSNLIFLVSLPRSGSTMLQRVLGSHGDIHTASEPWIMLHPVYALKREGITTDYEASLARSALDDFLENYPDGEQVYLDAIRAMGNILYTRILEKSGKKYFLDKTPRYFHIVPELKRIFPEARFVFLLRNPAAVLSSTLQAWFDNDTRVFETTYNYGDLYRGPSLLQRGIEALGEDAIVVRYEDLVASPEETVRLLCARLGIDYRPDMLSYGSGCKLNGRYGEPAEARGRETPVTDYRDKWIQNLVAAGLQHYACDYVSKIGNAVLDGLGYPGQELIDTIQNCEVDRMVDRRTGATSPCAEGEALFQSGDIEGARDKYIQALEQNPSNAELYNDLAACLWQLGNPGEALLYLSRGLAISPDYRPLIINGGQILAECNRHDDAIALFESYLSDHPEDAGIGELLRSMGGGQHAPAPPVGEDEDRVPLSVLHDDGDAGNGVLVSVIVSTYNSEELIAACLEDLENQTLADKLEVIVVDSGSQQNESAIVESYRTRFRNIRYVRCEERETLYAAWNRGIKLARGKYITNANTDDAHHPQALEKLVAVLERDADADLAYAHSAWTSEPNDSTGASAYRLVEYPAYEPALGMLYCFLGPHPVWRRTVFEKIGLFNGKYRAAGDLEFQMRFIRAGLRAVRVPEVLSLFYQNQDGLTLGSPVSDREAEAIKQDYRQDMPISRLYPVAESDTKAASAAWAAQGDLATGYNCPWRDGPDEDREYAMLCYQKALELQPDNRRAMRSLIALLGNMGAWAECDRIIATAPELIEQDIVSAVRKRQAVALHPSEDAAANAPVAPDPTQDLPDATGVRGKTPLEQHGQDGSFGFNVIGYVSGNLGLGVAARHLIQSLLDKGYPVAILDLDPGQGRTGYDHRFRQYYAEKPEQLPYSINLFTLSPACLGAIWPPHRDRFIKPGRMQVAFSMWELPVLPPQWISVLEEFDVRVAESNFIRYTFDFNLAKGRTLFTRHPVYLPDTEPRDRASLGIPDDSVVFMSAFEPFSDPMRKNPGSVVRAFLQGVGNDEKAHLVIKINNAASNGELHPAVFELQEQTNGHPRIHFVTDSLPYEQVIALYAMADVFVSLHRSEGLGLVLMEMMSLGKPVIATAWSGNMSYMDHCNACLVKYRLIPLNGSISFYSQEFLGRETVWAEPDVDDAALWMRRLVDDSDLRNAIGRAARRSAEESQRQAETLHFAEELKQIWQQEVMSEARDRDSTAALPGQQALAPHAPPDCPEDNIFPLRPVSQVQRLIVADRIDKTWTTRPAFHLIVFVDAAQSRLLASTIDSLQNQLYPGWGLSIVSGNPPPETMSDDLGMIEWLQCTDDPLAAAMGTVRDTQSDWVALLGAGDILHAEYLTAAVDYTNRYPEWALVYVDEGSVTADGTLTNPRFKPDFNLDLLRSTAYTGSGVLVRRAALLDCGGLQGHWRSAGYDLTLRILDQYGEKAIGHIPEILCHSRELDEAVRAEAVEAREIRALEQHLERNRIHATVNTGIVPGSYYIDYRHSEMPRVSVIIPTRDRLDLLQPCVESLLEKTSYPEFEVLIVDNQSEDPDTLVWLDAIEVGHPGVTVIRYPHPYNYSAINNLAVECSDSEYVLLLNNDTQIVQANWLERMLAHAQRPEVGIVGARLVYPDQTVQHAGVVLGMTNVADHPHIGLPLQEPGYMDRAQLVQNYSAVTAACMLVRKSVFQEAGGLDEDNFRVLFNDVDFCLKTVELGYKIVWTPYATVVHLGSSSVARNLTDRELARRRGEMFRMYEKWMPKLAADPAFNRNLSLVDRQVQPERDLIPGWDPQFHDRPRVLGFPFDDWGCGEYRVKAPVRAMTQAVMIQSVVAPKSDARRVPGVTELARMAPDVLLLQSFVHDFQMEALGQYRKLLPELFCVFELDDLKTQMPAKNPYHKTMYKDIRKRLRRALALCDRMIVTTEPLREAYRKLSDDIVVVPNYLERERWCNLVSKRRTGSRPRVGWAGAQQHHGDLELLYDVVRETAGEIEWVFFGMCPKELRASVSEFYPGVPFDRYPDKLASLNLDLAVAPLEHNKFNEAKSNLRMLEYGVLGLPVIATDILPYQDAPVARVANTPRAWISAIREHVNDLDAAGAAGDRLRQWVLDDWILEDHLGDWLRALTPGTDEAGVSADLRHTGTG